MTEDNQAIDLDRHYLTVCATESRISGNHLSTKQPDYGNLKVLRMENVFQVQRNNVCKEKIIYNLHKELL